MQPKPTFMTTALPRAILNFLWMLIFITSSVSVDAQSAFVQQGNKQVESRVVSDAKQGRSVSQYGFQYCNRGET